MDTVNCLKCGYRHPDNGNCTAIGGFCTAVPAAHCPLLHDYLDVGLMPDQVANAKVIIESAFADDTSKAERIRELLKADAEGRIVVLPCKVGATVYCVSKRYKRIDELTINSMGTIILLGKKWGKCVFVSREEAEQALEVKRNV